ncbi:hypothetical protein [Prosthecobacter sp.]|uniref:hypothetical protein n=1 Tax=Prosthecobacter sp. TaxID=1965333 RepID=UPI001D83E22B|nr:hypothetical protein [Prosthecobacter sp.]MCB1277551.1 hypothetical protein [Prosthecobacter sp.]
MAEPADVPLAITAMENAPTLRSAVMVFGATALDFCMFFLLDEAVFLLAAGSFFTPCFDLADADVVLLSGFGAEAIFFAFAATGSRTVVFFSEAFLGAGAFRFASTIFRFIVFDAVFFAGVFLTFPWVFEVLEEWVTNIFFEDLDFMMMVSG